MEVNSEAIYNTRPLEPFQENNICFTQSKDGKTMYAIYLKDEGEELPATIHLSTHFMDKKYSFQLLGYSGKLQINNDKNTIITLPINLSGQMKSSPALVFSITSAD
jgi:alpha-L-fucosidase